MKKILLILATAIYILSLMCFLKILTADLSYMESRNYLEKNNLGSALNKINASVEKNPYEPRYFYEKAKILLALDKDLDAIKNLEQAQKLNEDNLVTLRNMVPIYSFTSEDLAENYYEKLKNKYETDAGLLVQIAEYEKSLNLIENYNETTEMISKLRPDLLEWAL